MLDRMDHTGLTALLQEAGGAHHQAFLSTDGGDPEWPLWYAGWLQTRLWDRAGRLPTRSELVRLLLEAEEAHAAADTDEGWPSFYATRILDALAAD